MKSLASYLEKIKQGEPIALSQFKARVKQLDLDVAFTEADIDARRVDKQHYVVQRITPELLNALERLCDPALDDRISAAHQNRSHAHKVKGNYLLVRSGRAHPTVILFDAEGHATPDEQPNKVALIVENRQLFLSIEQTLAFIEQHCDIDLTSQFDVILSSGNEITNTIFIPYLNHYHTLFLLFDLEFGAIKSAETLLSRHPQTQIHFLLPNDIKLRLKHVVEVLPPEIIDKVIQIGMRQPLLAHPVQLIKEHRKKLEQESYLYGY